MDRPLTGGGFKFHSRPIFARYHPEFLEQFGNRVWDTHNIYLAILAAHGFPGFFIWSAMIFFLFLSCWQLQRLARKRTELKGVWAWSNMIMVSLVAFLVNGMFVNMEYFDLPFHFVSIVACLRVICARAIENEEQPAERFQSEALAS